MKSTKVKYVVIGAGVSGLTTANLLLQAGEEDFLVLEGRERIGGRVLTQHSIDMGATWFNKNHEHLLALLKSLGIKPFEQYSTGNSLFVYSSMAPPQYFDNSTDEMPIYRAIGGTKSIVEELALPLQDKIRLNVELSAITEEEQFLKLETTSGIYLAEKVILTIPPKLATAIKFSPALPESLQASMQKTHTWMSNAIKVGIQFNRPFWREKGLSGTLVGQVGAVIELYDHCNKEETVFSLMGFVNEALRDLSAEERKEKVLNYIEKHLGKELRTYRHYEEKDWFKDEYTSCQNLKSIYMSPVYGDQLFQETYMSDRLIFSGTETAPLYGGYLEGAVYSGELAAEKVLRG